MPITQEALANWFTYHAPANHPLGEAEAVRRYHDIREGGRVLAELIVECTPASADQTAAVRLVREAVMTANAALACMTEEQAAALELEG